MKDKYIILNCSVDRAHILHACLDTSLPVSCSTGSPFTCLFASLSVCPCICLSVCLSVCLYVCMYVSLAHPWSQDIIRRLARKMVMLSRQENEKIFRKACSTRICIKTCSSCDRTFWEVGHKGRVFCSICHNSQQIQKPILMLPCSCRIGETDFLQFCKDAMPKLSLENFQNCHLIMVI